MHQGLNFLRVLFPGRPKRARQAALQSGSNKLLYAAGASALAVVVER